MAVVVMALFAGTACAVEQVGSFAGDVSSSDAVVTTGGYSILSSDVISSEWWTSIGDSSWESILSYANLSTDNVVLTIPTLEMSATPDGTYIAAVTYDFSALGDYYADTDNTLTFYPNYEDTTQTGTALFLDESGEELTAYKINSSKSTMNGYIVMDLTSGDTYNPFVAVQLTSSNFAITHDSIDIMQLSHGNSDTVAFTAESYAGNVQWSVALNPDSSYSVPVKASIESSDEGQTATLTFTVPKSADIGQSGYATVTATDMTTGATASANIYYDAYPQLELSLTKSLVSVDLNDSVTLGLNVTGAMCSVSYDVADSWVTLENSSTYSRDVVIAPWYSFMEGDTWPVTIDVRDCRSEWSSSIDSDDPRSMAAVTFNVHIYGQLAVEVSSASFTVSSADTPEVTFTSTNASGDVSFDLSVDWASVQDNKFVVSTLDESLAGTTQTVTVTARDDRGRAGNSRGEATLTLSVTISDDVALPFELSVSPESITVNQGGSGAATLTPTNAKGDVSYSVSPSWATLSGNTVSVNYDSAYANSEQTVTITATDSGRESNNTATATLSVSFGSYTLPDNPDNPDNPYDPTTYSLSLTPATTALSVTAGADYSVNLSLSGASGTGVTWSYGYDSVPNGADSSSNPLGLAFTEESSSSAVLTLSTESNAVPGKYTVHVYTTTTTGTSYGGDNTITITVAPATIAITPDSVERDLTTGEDFTLEFTASNVQGALSWSLSGESWEEGTNPLRLSPSSLAGLTDETITIAGSPLRSGTYSFTVNVADEDGEEASSSVMLRVTGDPIIISDDARRADKVPDIEITPIEITPEMKTQLRETFGLSESVDIYALTSDNLLSPVSPDVDAEYAMKQRGYQLAANLSRISVSTGGYYAFQITIPNEYVSLNIDDLTVFSELLSSSYVSTSSVKDSAYDEDGLYQGNLAATDGTAPDMPARDMISLMLLEPNTLSATYFASKVIPAEGLNELAITTVEITDDMRSNFEQSLSADVARSVQSITEENIGAPIEPSQETIDAIKAEDNFELAYKLNSIHVDKSGYYAFTINIPSELLNTNADQVKVYIIEQSAATGSSFRSSIVPGILNVIELDAFGLKLNSLSEKIIAVGLLNAGTPLSVYLGKLIIMLLLSGCQVSFSGMGTIALAGAVLILGGARLLRRR